MTYSDPNAVKIYNLEEEINRLKTQVRNLTLSNEELWRIVRRLIEQDSSTEQESSS